MFPSLKECEEIASLPNKFTLIMATNQSNITTMMQSIFSILTKSGNNLDHIIVGINGADPRQGNIELQNNKQKFLDELRLLQWKNKDMPLTVIRVWSRIGHAQTLEMGIPWVHTEYYGIIHDDTIIEKENWDALALLNFQNNSNLVIQCLPPLLSIGLHAVNYENSLKLGFPNLNTSFILCRKSILTALGTRWSGHHVPYQVDWNKINKIKFEEFYTNMERLTKTYDFQIKDILSLNNLEYISLDIGGWLFLKIIENQFNFSLLPPDTAHHIGGQSWGHPKIANTSTIKKLEEELQQFPEYWNLYNKFKK